MSKTIWRMGKTKMEYEEKYYDFLDGLRESGITNMFGSVPYLLNQFQELDQALAKKILVDWIETFGERHPKREGERCQKV